GIFSGSPDGRHSLRSSIARRNAQSSATTANVTRVAAATYVDFSALSPPPVASGVSNSIDPFSIFQVPLNVGQPSPFSVNVPFASNVAVNAPNANGDEGSMAGCA